MSMIVDEGSLLFGALAVLGITLFLTGGGVLLGGLEEYQEPATTDAGATVPGATREAHVAVSGLSSGLGAFTLLGGVAILYVPGLIFVMSVADPRTGSFGVALTRDYGSIAPCILMSVAAAELLFGAAWLVLSPVLHASSREAVLTAFLLFMGMASLGVLYFAVLAWLAVRTVWGARPVIAFAAVAVPFVVMPFAGLLSMLASPFILYWVYIYTRGDISAIQWSMGSRRAFKRHMEASTLNPRDADAHYQLGLIHHHRRQYPEAIARFEQAVAIDPSEIDAHYQLGRIAREQGRHADAIRHLEPVVARDPKYARYEIWREVGATYFEAGDFTNARAMLTRYIDNRPYDAEGLCLLGLALKNLGEPEGAAEMLKRAVEAAKTAPVYRRGELRPWRKRAEAAL
jgi:tetratricopeptide (TPR) repeat protein